MAEKIKVNPIWSRYPDIKEELIRCKAFMLDSIDIPNTRVRGEVIKLINDDAKFIRPAFMIMIGKIINGGEMLDDDFIKIAATIEMLHMATLIHDDVVDDSPKRRGMESLQRKYGKDVAVYAGDYMLSSVFSNVVKYARSMENIEKITKTVNEILAGELIQMQYRGDLDIDEASYYRIIKGKTAALIALCCYEGAYMTASYDLAEKMWELGESVGMSFQIRDDIIDLTSNAKTAKKPVNQDFREGNYTLPIIKAKDKYRMELENIIKNNIYDEVTYSKIREIALRSGGIDYAKSVSSKYSDRAVEILEILKDSKNKKYLSEIISKMLNRKY